MRAIGNNKWQAHNMAMGKMATNLVIFQLQGINVASAMMIITTIINRDKHIDHLNFLATLGTSMKKLENSTSFAVAPHDMSISSMWQRRACET